MSDAFPRGRFVWFDLMTPDPEAALAFYTTIVGWGTEDWDGPMEYKMLTGANGPIGGVMQLPAEAQEAGAPPHWIAYIGVEDVDATVEQATGLGATVQVPPQEIPGAGRFAVLGDPQGAAFAVYTSNDGTAGGHDDLPQVGQFSWHELMTTDHEAAFEFYSTLFGWQKNEAMDMGEMGVYQMYHRVEEVPLGGMMNLPPGMPMPAWLYYVRVEDVHAAAETVKELGGQILNGPMEVPGGDYVVQCLDPQGGAFALHHVAPQN